MRRSQQSGTFEVVIKAPTLGLYTRIPGEQPDARAATAASNVRFAEGVAMNAPGYGKLVTSPRIPKSVLLFQQITFDRGGTFVPSVVVGTQDKLYSLFRYPESTVVLFHGQHDFETEAIRGGSVFYGGTDLWDYSQYAMPLTTFWANETDGYDSLEDYPTGDSSGLFGGFGWGSSTFQVLLPYDPQGFDSLEDYPEGAVSSLSHGETWGNFGEFIVP